MNSPSVAIVTTNSAELTHLAQGLADRGRLAAYGHAFISPPPGTLFHRSIPKPLHKRLDRRAAPVGIAPHLQHSLTPWSEALQISVPKSLPAAKKRLLHRRAARMSRAAARLPGDALVISHAAALDAFRRSSPSRFKVLNMPSVHPRERNRIIRAEAERHPELADTILGNLAPKHLLPRFDAEFDLADLILVGSHFAARSLIDGGVNPSKVAVSPYGLRPVSVERAASPGPLRILFAGRLTQAKGLSYLLEAYDFIRDTRTVLTVIGAPQGDLRALPGFGQWWQPRPPVSRLEMQSIYQAADVFVLPSLFEGLPLSVLEAMSTGIPVIVTPTGADDVVRDGVEGFVVPLRDSTALAERLSYLRDHPSERLEMGIAAARRAREYSWPQYIDRTLTLIDERWGRRSLANRGR